MTRVIDLIRRLLGTAPDTRKAARIETQQHESDSVLTRARRERALSERDRLASAVTNTVRAVRQQEQR